MKRFLIHILIYGISLALSLKFGGIYIGKASLAPLCMIVPSIIMALLWRGNDMPVNTSGDVTLTEEERRTMLLAASNTLYASVPLQILLTFTWYPFLKTLFAVLVFVFSIGIGMHIGKRMILSSVYDRMNKTSNR